ncbi:hypothetical protein ACP70R_010415 [Stipagrostis hirtigluma subsp. patula]
MGCATSTEARRDMIWVDADPRARRSFSLPSVDRQLLRSRAVSVLGTLGITGNGRRSGSCKYAALSVEEMMKGANDHRAAAADVVVLRGEDAVKRPAVAKPRTQTLTPPNEPEVINAWELMAGLEDDAPTPRAVQQQSSSLDETPHGCVVEPPPPTPPWMQVDMDIPMALEFDPEILSGFREALEDTPPSPSPPTVIPSAVEEKSAQQQGRKDGKVADAGDTPLSAATRDMPELSGIVRARINAFQERIERRRSKGGREAKVSPLWPPGGERKAVVYFTSLRGVRKTFVDCCAVRSILRSYGVRVDERDVSMHAVFKAELAGLLGPGSAGAALPRVFVDGRYLGGAEDVHCLHEAGELGRALEGCDAAPARKLGYMEACAACGDVRFVPCETCYGSCKIFVEDDDADGRYYDAGEFRRCPDCNENGLVRCPVCCC